MYVSRFFYWIAHLFMGHHASDLYHWGNGRLRCYHCGRIVDTADWY
jgi:hypothetical protein